MHGLPQARRTADQRHEAETADQARQRRDVDVASFRIDQGRAQDRPADTARLADAHDCLLGLREFLQHLALGRDFAVELGEDAGRRERNDALWCGIEKMRQRARQQDRIGGAIKRGDGGYLQCLRLFQVADDPVRVRARARRARQRTGARALAGEMLQKVAADQSRAADHQAVCLCHAVFHARKS